MLGEEDSLVTGVTNFFHVGYAFCSRGALIKATYLFTSFIYEVQDLHSDSSFRRYLASNTGLGGGGGQNWP